MKVANKGLTLIELMVTVAVLAVLLTIAAPSFSNLIMNNRLATTASEVQSALSYARAEAVTRRQFVAVCISANGTTCSATGNWQDGLLVFTDGGVAGVVDGSDQILKYIQFASAGLQINPVNAGDFGGNRYVRFTSRGSAVAGGQLKFCDTRVGNYGRQLALFSVGRTESIKQLACP